jgi:glycosyltransferase involved in cell wall biosynthesis
MHFGNSPFNLNNQNVPQVQIPQTAEVVFVSDAFVEQYVGGAELTSEALIQSSPFEIFKLNSANVTVELLEAGHDKFWIFGNFSALDQKLIPTIIANMKYSIVEYDYKFCRYRSIEKHFEAEKSECNCHNETYGKVISAFFQGSRSIWWMSEKQQKIYLDRFPFLAEKPNTVLSSVFDEEFFGYVNQLKEKHKDKKSETYLVLGSNSWVKGAESSEKYCKENNLDYEVVWNLPYEKLLDKLASSKGLVFLPEGADTCPRLVIEAKLLGCELILNENVQHKDEYWFSSDDILDTESYLYAARSRFWNGIKSDMNYALKLSGYTTTKDCIDQNYPWKECIASLLGFCDEVVVVDGGSKDGTWEELQELARSNSKMVIHQEARDWNHERFAVFDGLQKALARSLCTGNFCWQQDCDEVVHENDYEKVKNICKNFPDTMDLIALPVVEFWGGKEKVRADIYPWKWRLSRNRPHITHGIPANLRRFDKWGHVYSLQGSDGCDYIRSDNFEVIPCGNFYTQDVENVRVKVNVNPQARQAYQDWYEQVMEAFPCVYHFSWWDLERKIKTYRDYWGLHWRSLYNEGKEDTADNNMMFDCAWSEVTEEMIKDRASLMKEKLGGWIWHTKWDGEEETAHIKLNKALPKVIQSWIS